MTTLGIKATASGAAELQTIMRGMLGLPKLDVYATDAILQELRDRFRPQSLVVQIVPFETPDEPEAGSTAPAEGTAANIAKS